tara:strand:- start:20926 stop:21483 length:558 start_codon:yes stop_codon:yes gene_type:complete
MSEYFTNLPNIEYDIEKIKPRVTTTATNIFLRTQLHEAVARNAVTIYPYIIQDEERPDTLSYSYYGSVKYTWIIFFANNIMNPLYDWPLSNRDFSNFILNKYGTLALAKNTVHHYEKIIRSETSKTSEFHLEIDSTTYDGLGSSERVSVSGFDYYRKLNEAKRQIKLIDDAHVKNILKEARKVFR